MKQLHRTKLQAHLHINQVPINPNQAHIKQVLTNQDNTNLANSNKPLTNQLGNLPINPINHQVAYTHLHPQFTNQDTNHQSLQKEETSDSK